MMSEMDEYEYLKENSKLITKAVLEDCEVELYVTPKTPPKTSSIPLVTLVITKDGKKEYHIKRNMSDKELYELMLEINQGKKC